ncbi:hypothetical protein RIF29_35081 [Crotalaria pallida]|uniref:Dehydrin n=1 Tax=Crotalaria pallida TaxID=3830 RepID=A0AAN9E9K1_CROPI
MENYQNQYGAVPASKDPIQMEMDSTGDTTGLGGSTQVIANDEYDNNTTSSDTSGVVGATNVVDEGGDVQQHHHKKKGIIEKIKDKLPGTHHHKSTTS